MNRKKITLLLTGLVVASSMMMGGCSSSNNGSTNSNNGTGSSVSSENSGFTRSTDRTVTEYNGGTGVSDSDVAYAEDTTPSEGITNNNSGIDDTNSINNSVNSTNDTINRNGNGSYNNGYSYGNDSYNNSGYDSDSYSNGGYTGSGYGSTGYTDDSYNGVGNNGYGNGNYNGSDNTGYGYNYGTDNSYSGSGYSVDSIDGNNSYDNTNSYQNNGDMNGTAGAFDGGVAYDDSYTGDTTNGGSFNNDTTNGTNSSLYNGTDTTNGLNNGSSIDNGVTNSDVSMNNNSYGNTDGLNNNTLNNGTTSGINNGSSYDGTTNNDSLNNGVTNGNTSMNSGSYTNDTALNGENNGVNNGVDTQNLDGTGYIGAETRSAAQTTIVGEFIPLKAVGGSEIVGAGGDGKVQGTIGVTFKLSQEAISAMGLDGKIQAAYTEMINDSNNSFQGDGTTTARKALQAELKTQFGQNNNMTIMLRDPNGTLVNIPLTAANLFPDDSAVSDYARYIIDLGQMRSGGLRLGRSLKSNSTDVALRMIIRNATVDNQGNDELKTDTLYTFVGIGGTGANENNLKVGSSGNNYISGFSIPTTTTGKQPSLLTAKSENSTNALYESDNFDSTPASEITGGTKLLYTTAVKPSQFIDFSKYDTTKPKNIIASGNNIKFPNIVFNDPDDSIVRVEMQDNKGNNYPCSLVAQGDEGDSYYLQVNDLQPETRYVFTKINVVSNINGTEESDSILIGESGSGTPKVKTNTISVQTVKFTEPKISLGAANDAQVTLPDGLKVPAVKNDMNSLRYILRVDDSQGNLGDLRVTGVKDSEKALIERIVDKKSKINYYVVTLTNLQKDTDYGYLTLELDYTDLAGNTKNTRQSLSNINSDTNNKAKFDNRTEKEALTGTNAVNVILNTENKSKYARSAQVPVFIDDMNRMFTGMNFTSPTNSNAKVEYREGYLYVTGLEPETTTDITLDFTYNDATNNAQKLTKYIKVTTTSAPRVDVIADTATVEGNQVSIKFDYSQIPTTPIQSIAIKDANDNVIDSTWDSATSTVTLTGLKANTQYSDLVATFTLQNTLTVDYPITPFSTAAEIVKPTGKVADFVKRVYTIALGREPEVQGWNFWIDKLQKKEITATEFIAENLMTQPEFVDRELSKPKFVTTMYSLIVNREPDQDGQAYWERKYDEYASQVQNIAELRIKIAREMMDQQEFKDLVTSLNLRY